MFVRLIGIGLASEGTYEGVPHEITRLRECYRSLTSNVLTSGYHKWETNNAPTGEPAQWSGHTMRVLKVHHEFQLEISMHRNPLGLLLVSSVVEILGRKKNFEAVHHAFQLEISML